MSLREYPIDESITHHDQPIRSLTHVAHLKHDPKWSFRKQRFKETHQTEFCCVNRQINENKFKNVHIMFCIQFKI